MRSNSERYSELLLAIDVDLLNDLAICNHVGGMCNHQDVWPHFPFA